MGAEFAANMGDSSSADKYNLAAKSLNDTLADHYKSDEGFVYESTNRELDGAVIGAFAELYMDDGIFGPTTKEVANTIKAYN